MDLLMDTKSMQELAKQLAKNLKTEDDLNQFTAELTKMSQILIRSIVRHWGSLRG